MWYDSTAILFIYYLKYHPFTNPQTSVQTKELKGISIDLLVPGMMVNARVQSTLENGILLSFLTYFTGTVCQHLCFFYQNSTNMYVFHMICL